MNVMFVSIFWLREGYLITSSFEFSLNGDSLNNQYIHLTNNAIQKKSEFYGSFEEGNQLSFEEFQLYIDNNFEKIPHSQFVKKSISVRNDIYPSIKNLILKSLGSVKQKLNPKKFKFCYELLGYDFLIDKDFNVWLIEINTNPCLELSSKLLQTLIPRMLDDLLKLTLDKIFPPLQNISEKAPEKNYSVEGYEDSELIWEKLCNLNENIQSMAFEQSRINSEYLISINERKTLKIIKNECKNNKKKIIHYGKLQFKKSSNDYKRNFIQNIDNEVIE